LFHSKRRTDGRRDKTDLIIIYRGADKSLARPTSPSVFFSVHGTGGSPTGPDPEIRVGDQVIGSPGRPVSSGLQVPGEPFLSGRAKDLSAPLCVCVCVCVCV
jgi:hypothetical protein